MIIGKRFSVSADQLATSAGTLYEALNVNAQVQAFILTNTSAGAVTATVHLVPSGGSAGNANMILKAKSLNAGESYKVIEAIGQWLSPGDTIQALSSDATSVSAMLGGIEVS